jgi:uncharacterized protein (UPF0371 family)
MKQDEIDSVVELRRIEKEQSRLDARKAALAGRMIEERQGGKMVKITLNDGDIVTGRLVKTFYTLDAVMYYKLSMGVYERARFIKVRDTSWVEDL